MNKTATEPTKNRRLWLVAAGLISLLIVGFYLIYTFANAQRDQDLKAWYQRLDLIAESRSSEISAWINRHLQEVEEISRNATLGLYAGEVMMAGDSDQRGYAYNYLNASAARGGFHEKTPLDQIAANVQRPRRAGLGVMKGDGTWLLQTPGMPLFETEGWQLKGRRSLIELHFINKRPVVMMATPIKVIDGMDSGGDPIWLVGARYLGDDFYALLKQPGDSSTTGESYLVMQAETKGAVRPLSPLKQGGRIGDIYEDAAADFALRRPGAHGQYNNYAGKKVLVTGRELSAPVPWVLVRSVTGSEAFEEINGRRNSLMITLSLTIFTLLVILVLVWRHGVSAKLLKAYSEQSKLTQDNAQLSRFLQHVSNSQPAAIAAINGENRITFANEKLGGLSNLPYEELQGRRLETAFTADETALIVPGVSKALTGQKSSDVVRLKPQSGEAALTMQMDSIPLKDDGENPQALMVLQDITPLVAAQTRAENNLKQLVSALTRIIDARDPWSQYHSSRVAEVAPTIASEMGYNQTCQDTVRTAGQLMNLGKIFVPPQILTKTSPLNEEELTLVRDSMDKGADLLTGLEFGGPVEQTLRHARANWDGSGTPKGVAGEDIIMEARILAVANAFVGMVSSRAHREGFSFEKAMDILHQDCGGKYERRVVAALENLLENKGLKRTWQHYGDKVSMPE